MTEEERKAAQKKYKAEHYQKNKESIRAKQKLYREENTEKVKAQKREEYAKNSERYKVAAKKHRENNPEYAKQYAKDYWQKNKEKFSYKNLEYKTYSQEKSRRYKEKNKERYILRKRVLYNINREHILALRRVRSERDRDKLRLQAKAQNIRSREQRRVYRRKNSHRYLSHAANRRAKINRPSNSFKSNKNIINVIYETRKRVSACVGIMFHVDHIIPISRGGLHHETNLQILPGILNLRKSDKLL